MRTTKAFYLRRIVIMLVAGMGLAYPQSEAGDQVIFEEPVKINDFIHCFPQNAIAVDSAAGRKWNLRIKTWNNNPADVVLNPSTGAPPIFYALRLQGTYKVIVGARAVSVPSKFAVSFSSLKDSIVIDPPVTKQSGDHDVEIELPAPVQLSNDTLKIINLNQLAYVRYFKFIRIVKKIQSGIVLSTRVVLKAPGKHIAFPGFCRDKAGRLFVVAREGKTHVSKNDFGSIVMAVSTDTGRTWSDPKFVLNKSGTDYRDPDVVSTSDGRLLLTYNSFGAGVKAGLMSSSDGGKTWTEMPFPADIFSPNGIVEYRGALFYCGNRAESNVNYIDIITSPDNGKTWNDYSTVAISKPLALRHEFPYYDEPAMAIVSDTQWVCGFRVDVDGHIYTSISRHRGVFKSWSYPEDTKIAGTPPSFMELQDGNLLCSYGRRIPPYGIRASVFNTKTEKWQLQTEYVLDDKQKGTDLGYAKSLQLSDGTMLTVYYVSDADGRNAEVRITHWKLK